MKVEFFDGATKLAEDTTASYSYRWKNVASGAHQPHGQGDRQRGAHDDERRRRDHGPV